MDEMNDEMKEIFEGFLVETEELLDQVSQDLVELEDRKDDPDFVNGIFRGFHTIKGTSSFMGFDEISGITHEAEDLLNKLRRNELQPSPEITDVLLEVHDWIRKLLDFRRNGEEPVYDYAETIKTIKILRGDDPNAETQGAIGSQSTAPAGIDASAGSTLSDIFSDPSQLLDGDGDGFSDDQEALIQAAFAEINSSFGDSTDSESSDSPEEVSTEAPSPEPTIETPKVEQTKPEPKPSAPVAKQAPKAEPQKTDSKAKLSSKAQETVRVEVGRIETMMDLSGELVLGRNRLIQISEHFESIDDLKSNIRDLNETASQIDFVTSEIQSAVMKMRMIPVGKLYQKAPRIVRDLSREFGKKIKLVVKGEDTEIDRGIIEELNDPLVHMIRNSCDHGIESKEKRIEAGKSEEGTITLDADQEGNHIVLRIIDDGGGIDPEKITNKAIEKGVLTQEEADQMSDREKFQLIFAPGFSTAAKVTGVSGRGVGMDVVKTNIQKLKGIIEIDSEVGKGTTFTIKLPLTLAIIQGLLVKVKDETYAIPLSSVEEVVSVEEKSIETVNRQEVIRIREDVYPVSRLDKNLGLSSDDSIIDKNVVIVGIGFQRVGLVVDELLGQQEIVIKSLGKYLGNITGIAGSTILGDGRVIMIIDINELITQIYNKRK